MERKQERIYCLCYFTRIFTLFHFTHQLALLYITLKKIKRPVAGGPPTAGTNGTMGNPALSVYTLCKHTKIVLYQHSWAGNASIGYLRETLYKVL